MQKEYEIKITNGTGSMTKAKNEVLIGLLLKNCYSVGAMEFGEESLLGGTSLHHPSRENHV